MPLRELPLYQVDAFTGRLFAGNPAAVCPLDDWLDAGLMQAIAAENNLSETAFFVPAPARGANAWDLRWFTPAAEVDLCGHATLAGAFVLFTEITPQADEVRFHTRSGELIVRRDGDLLAMDFPVRPLEPLGRMEEVAADLGRTLGGAPSEILSASYLMGIHDNEDAVRALAPDFAALGASLERAGGWGYIATAQARPGAQHDFVSRFFAPRKGVPEDPVTGSAHCMLAPYWAARLGKTSLTGYQASSRGGLVHCEYDAAARPGGVTLKGACVLYLRGRIFV